MSPKQPNALHIAIIPDGNRRWARARAWHPWKGHEKATENFESLSEWCRQDPRIAILTVWCFSTENWKREPEEVSKLMELLESYIQKERPNLQKKRTRLVHSGRLDRIPQSLAKLIQEVCAETAHFTDPAPHPSGLPGDLSSVAAAKEEALAESGASGAGFTLHLAVDYGGKDEILRALSRAKKPVSSEEELHALLDHPELPDIDLIIRTSGEQRTSNFCLWQSTYAEWVFIDKYFPDFTAQDLTQAVDDFSRRSRRFGA
jgi:undecaprenyl diphosphate synthase